MFVEKIRALAKVIASLRPGYLTVIYGYGYGHIDGGVAKDISIACIPYDLRMPNSEFILVCDRQTGKAIGIERIN